MWHTLEHTYNPLSTLREIYGFLKNNGILYVEVPNSASIVAKIFRRYWFGWDLPRHLYHFTPSILKKILIQTGFKKSKMEYHSKSILLLSSFRLFERLEIDSKCDPLSNRFIRIVSRYIEVIMSFFNISDIIIMKAQKS